jgi:hypothetical protein
MNALALFLRDHRDAVDRVEGRQRVGFWDINELVDGFVFPFDVDAETLDALSAEEPHGDLLRDAYLPVIENESWRSRLESAMPPARRPARPGDVNEWVTFAEARQRAHGVSLPDDDDRRALRLSMFARTDFTRRVSIEYASGPGRPTGVAVSAANGCSLPDWGECYGDDCGGDCQLRRVHDDDDGMECHCPHEEGVLPVGLGRAIRRLWR